MYNIGIIGDVHITPNVNSRKDNFFETCMLKLEEVASNCQNIIILGDLFDKEVIPLQYFSQLYTVLMYFVSKGHRFYSIVGNHDVYNYLEESLPRTSLGLLDTLGVVELITPEHSINIGKYTFITSYVKPSTCKNHLRELHCDENIILLLHQYYEEFNGLVYDDLKDLGCKHIFLGHEHSPLPHGRIVYPEFTIYRCGSLTRNRADSCNLNRVPYYFVFQDDEIICKTLDCAREPKDIFNEESFTRQNYERRKFVEDIKSIVDKYSEAATSNNFSVKDTLLSLNPPINIVEYIKDVYARVGVDLV